jgi:hypothetical protein
MDKDTQAKVIISFLRSIRQDYDILSDEDLGFKMRDCEEWGYFISDHLGIPHEEASGIVNCIEYVFVDPIEPSDGIPIMSVKFDKNK